jgi:hypothetical protein
MIFIIKHKSTFIGAAIGAAAGLAYWYFVGCADGTCAITSNPYRSSIYGMIMGIIAGDGFKSKEKKETLL